MANPSWFIPRTAICREHPSASFFKLVYFANGVGKKAKAISSIRNIYPTPARGVSTSWFLHMTISVHREKY